MKLHNNYIRLLIIVCVTFIFQNIYCQGEWESGSTSSQIIGTTKRVSIGTYPPMTNVRLNLLDNLTSGSAHNLYATNHVTHENLAGDFISRLGSSGVYLPQGQGQSVMGMVSNLSILNAKYSDVTARAAGGYFYTSLNHLTMNTSSGGTYRVAGIISILTGTVNDFPENKVFAGLYAADEIKSDFNTWAGYFDGNVGIDGFIRTKEVKIQLPPWSDFVFDKNYDLKTLNEVEIYIRNNHHLPDIPSAKEVKREGINIGEINAKFLQKIEELTLYIIEQNKRIDMLEKKLADK